MKRVTLTGIGADVEVFLQDKATKEIISAEGYVKGSKQKPFIFDEQQPDFATSLDNVLAEFGIPPATNKVQFYNYLRKSIRYIESTIPSSLCTAILPAAELDSKWLNTPQARRFGCDPDFNAYTGYRNPSPHCSNMNLRSAGGHIHIGYEEAVDMRQINGIDTTRLEIVKALDLFVGVPSVILEPDNQRKELYGKAGAFRPKTYGLEYRTVSNYYLQSRKLVYWVYDAVNNAINSLNNGMLFTEPFCELVKNTINNNDKQTANGLIKEYNLI